MKANFCLQCGTRLDVREMDGRGRAVCPKCGWVYYEQLKVGAAALVVQDGRLLLLQRGHEPFKGLWNIPAGYVEANEAPARAAERETFEECGLRISAGRLVDAYYFDDDPRGNGVLLVYACELLGGELRVNVESAAAGFFAADELPAPLALAGHNQAIETWRRGCEKRAG